MTKLIKDYKMKKILITLLLTLTSIVSMAQVSYSTVLNGENKPDVPYKVLKKQYDYRTYSLTTNEKYPPVAMAVASFFIPGLGQCICNEWGRGLGFFTANVALNTTSYILLFAAADSGESTESFLESIAPALICYCTTLGVDIWAIVDAVRVAKVKNMYFNDENYLPLNIKLEPIIALVPTCNNAQLTYGLSLKFSF